MLFNYCLCNHKKNGQKCNIILKPERNKLMDEYGLKILRGIHNFEGDNLQILYRNLANSFCINCEHAQKLYDYFSKGWLVAATPVMRHVSGKDTYPISCFVNTITGSKNETLMSQIMTMYKQLLGGGGMGVCISNVEEFKTQYSHKLNSGALCYVRALESMFDLIEPYKARPPVFVYYLNVNHPDIMEFVTIRKPTFDVNKMKLSSQSHVGVIITDDFMDAVRSKSEWNLISRNSNKVVQTIQAIDLWRNILITRTETGEPFIFFYNNAQRAKAKAYRALGIDVPCTNMCTEIMLPSGLDNDGIDRSTICCLASVNLEHYDEWKNDKNFIESSIIFLDRIMEYYIQTAKGDDLLKPSYRCALNSRPLGLGVMGWSFLLQQKMIIFGSEESFKLNQEVFSYIHDECEKTSQLMGEIFGHAPDNLRAGLKGRNVTKTAIAPTASISLVQNSSPGINPFYANCYIHKTGIGSNTIKNKYLDKIIETKFSDQREDIWQKILYANGSIQGLDIFNNHEKAVFRTAFEIDQFQHVKLCGERQKYLCQTQSVNVYVRIDVSKKEINELHLLAYDVGLPTLYYFFFSPTMQANNQGSNSKNALNVNDKKECTSCDS